MSPVFIAAAARLRLFCVLLPVGLVACAVPPTDPQPPVVSAREERPAAAAAVLAPAAPAPAATPMPTAVMPSSPLAAAESLPVPAPPAALPANPTATANAVMATGLASWYGKGFQGRRTASGERYDMREFTAAHRTLPFGTRVRVRSVHTGKEVVVRINDRGPYKHQRIIDLSLAAAQALGVHQRGVTQVQLLRE